MLTGPPPKFHGTRDILPIENPVTSARQEVPEILDLYCGQYASMLAPTK
jgi:hypothetical protein